MCGAFRAVAGLTLLIGMFWPRISEQSVFWSISVGGVIALVWFLMGRPFGIAPLWPALLGMLVVLIPLTLASKEKVSPGYKLYRSYLAKMG